MRARGHGAHGACRRRQLGQASLVVPQRGARLRELLRVGPDELQLPPHALLDEAARKARRRRRNQQQDQQNPKADGVYIGNPVPRPNDVAGDVKLTGYGASSGPTNASNGLVYTIGGLLVPPGANPIPPRDHTEP